MPYRLYVDESGHHTKATEADAVGRRYLGLVGVAFKREDHLTFTQSLNRFKDVHCDDHDPDDPPILHREDVLGRNPGFRRLSNRECAEKFYSGFVQSARAPYTVFIVVVDKVRHGEKHYRSIKHPYHFCLNVLVEKYVRFLDSIDDVGDVLAESRGGKEDIALKEQYRHLLRYGTNYWKGTTFRERLTSGELKIKKKEANIAGLQLADMIAFGATRDVLAEYRRFSLESLCYLDRSLVNLIQQKYYQSAKGSRPIINGWGRVILS